MNFFIPKGLPCQTSPKINEASGMTAARSMLHIHSRDLINKHGLLQSMRKWNLELGTLAFTLVGTMQFRFIAPCKNSGAGVSELCHGGEAHRLHDAPSCLDLVTDCDHMARTNNMRLSGNPALVPSNKQRRNSTYAVSTIACLIGRTYRQGAWKLSTASSSCRALTDC